MGNGSVPLDRYYRLNFHWINTRRLWRTGIADRWIEQRPRIRHSYG